MEFYIRQIYVNITDSNIHIHNSYMIDTAAEKQAILNEIFSHVADFPRSYQSALREWKAHNVLYKLHIKRKSTAHTDIEAKPKWFYRVGYFILSLFSFIE